MDVDINISNKFTKDENELMTIIRNVIKAYSPNTKAFLVGGFVRDKLLGKESHDIDIMLDNISGAKFAYLVTRFLNINDPHVVKANPDASKHLETAGASIPLSSGTKVDVDFAMARTEVYNENSRIPEIQVASPQDDMFRDKNEY